MKMKLSHIVVYSVIAGVVIGHYATLELQHQMARYKAHVVAEALRDLPPVDTLSSSDRQTLDLVRQTRAKMQEMRLPRAAKVDQVAMLIEEVK